MLECECGRKHKSRFTVRQHANRIAAGLPLNKCIGDKTIISSEVLTNINQKKQEIKNLEISKNKQANIIKEINLKPEFDNMGEKVLNPKKDKDENTYKCGRCNAELSGKVKYCHECGAEFE